MKNDYLITLSIQSRRVRAYVSARRLTSAVRLALQSEKARFGNVESIVRL